MAVIGKCEFDYYGMWIYAKVNPYYLNTKIYSKNETSTPSPSGFAGNLHTCATLRVVFPAKVLPYSFFP